jgi:hypothetical protein
VNWQPGDRSRRQIPSDVDGYITGVRFYKSSLNTGAHIGHLWSSDGALLATATFTSETTSGWQEAYFAIPVQILANTTYIASYFSPGGPYFESPDYFTTAFDNQPLRAWRQGRMAEWRLPL